MEDAAVLDDVMSKYEDGDRLKAFDEFSALRAPDAHTACDLSIQNYHLVGTRPGS
jgi:hypothetical protein